MMGRKTDAQKIMFALIKLSNKYTTTEPELSKELRDLSLKIDLQECKKREDNGEIYSSIYGWM